MTQVVEPVAAGQTITTSYGYDANGNNTRVTDGRSSVYTMTYNPWNLNQDVVEPSTAAYPNLSDRTWTVVYDGGGLAVKEVQPGTNTVTRTFNQVGKLTAESATGGASRSIGYDLALRATSISHPTSTINLTYDDRSLLTSVTGGAGSSSYTYDANGRPLTRTRKTSVSDFFTEADARAESDIVAALTQLRPGDAILGEEEGVSGSGERLWYAVATTFKNNLRAPPINSDTRGTISVRNALGNLIHDGRTGSGVVAVIIAS